MASDSDDDFERFLQEDDSASMSSASPVKRKASKDTTSSKKKKAAPKAKASSSSSKAYGGGSSLSVVAAAEKLLAASGRASAKKHAVVEEADEDDDEPPPSYSDDPYAFDLGDTTSRYSRKSDGEEDDDDGASGRRPSSRRGSKSSKGKADYASAKAKKTKDKSKEKESKTIKGEAKSAKTLEDRIADILKRTGSTTLPSGSAATKDKPREDSDGYDDNSDSAEEKEVTSAEKNVTSMDTKDTPPVGNFGGKASGKQDERGSESDQGSQSHRLSFSDSLGMESADFEVGAFAKRKLDRSRLSLSSLNSEKFAVNLDALDESEHVSQNRYDDQNENYGRSVDTSEPAESDYDDEGFELDQTTEVKVESHDTTEETLQHAGTNAESPFVSQFESMKSLFSLDSPIKLVDSSIDTRQEELFIETTNVHSRPPESDNFGYDDEDFEADEAPAIAEQTSATIDENKAVISAEGVGDYANETFDNAEEEHVVGVPEDAPASMAQQHVSPTAQSPAQLADSLPEQATAQSPYQFEVISTVVSVTETRAGSASKTEESEVSRTKTVAPSPPKSPPPPPPPDDQNEEDQIPPSPPPSTMPPSHLHAPVVDANAVVERSVDRFREIEHKVSSLRFVPASSRLDLPDRRRAAASQEKEEQRPFIDDPSTLQEIKDIEQLVEQAKRVRNERRKSTSTRSSVKENELALRLQQAQRQLLQFKQHVQELAESSSDGESHSRHGEEVHLQSSRTRSSLGDQKIETPDKRRDDDKISRKEVEALKKEVQSQERLIQGFQRENEQLMKQLKQLQRDLQYDAHKENQSLRLQLKELRTLLDGATHTTGVSDGIEGKIQYKAAIEARLQAEGRAESLQDELKSQAKRHQDRVNELKLELEKVKKAKIDLEYRYEGINVEKMEAESQQIKLLKEQLQTQRAEHDHVVGALQKKIDWYVRNQRLLDDQDEKISEIKAENKRLKDEIAASTANMPARGGPGARSPRTPAKGVSRLPSDVRRIQELESRLSEMEEAMRKRHPDSLVSLMVASRKADDESKLREVREEHKREVDELTEEMERLEENNEKKLNSFRQQQEKLVLQYQKQIAELERQLANKEHARRGSAAQGKTPKRMTNTDEDELYRVRRFYAEKIKEVERRWEAKYRAVKKQHYAANGPSVDNPAVEQGENSPSDAARIIRTLHQKIVSQEDEIRRLQATGRSATGDDVLRRRVSSLELQLKTSEDARRHLIETISSLSAITPPPLPSETRPQRFVQDEQRREHELEAKMIAAQKEHEQSLAQYRGRIKTLEQQVADEAAARQQLANKISGDTKEVERLQKVLDEAEQEKRRLQQSAERAAALESEVMVLRDQISVPQTPSMLQFRSLELRIETLTQKHQLREAELKMLLAQATQSSQLEKLNFERMYQNAIALKNAEINTFKKQLGEILDELEALRRAPSTA